MLNFVTRVFMFAMLAYILSTAKITGSTWQYWAIMGMAVVMSAHSYVTGQLDGVKASVKKAYELAYGDFMKIINEVSDKAPKS